MKYSWRDILIISICLIVFTGFSGCKSKRKDNPGAEPRYLLTSKMRQGTFQYNSIEQGKQTLSVQARRQTKDVYTEIKAAFYFPENPDGQADNGEYNIEQIKVKVGGINIDSNEALPEPEKSIAPWLSFPSTPSPRIKDAADRLEEKRERAKKLTLPLFKKLCESPFEFNILDENNVTITKMPEYSEQLEATGTEIPNLQLLIDAMSIVTIKNYINMADNFFPDTEVGLGAIWHKSLPLKSVVSDQLSEDILLNVEYELASIDQNRARIKMSCIKKDNKVYSVVYENQKVDIAYTLLTTTGTIIYNLNENIIEKVESDNKASCKLTVPGQGTVNSQANYKATITIDKL